MKKGLKLLLIFWFVLGAIFFKTQAQQTKILTAEKHNEYGLIYTLPTTAIEFTIELTKEIRIAGPFYPYAQKYIGTSNVVKNDEVRWTINNISARAVGVPDPEQKYLMQLKAGALTFLTVGDDGMLLAINKKIENPQPVVNTETKTEGIKLTEEEYLQYVGEDFATAISTNEKAKILAEELRDIRDSKISLTRGTAETMPTDGRQLELMLESLARQEASITAAFTGNIVKETVVRKIIYEPEKEGREVLFRISDFAGLVDANDYSGEPVYISTTITNEGELPEDNKGEEKKFPKDGVAYCIPGSVKLDVTLSGKELYSNEFEAAQFGVVFGLNPSLFTDKKDPSYAIFNPATGALIELGKASTE